MRKFIFGGSYSGAPAYDVDAQAFITAAGITNPTQQTAINTLVVDLKGYGIWAKMKALYPFVGGTASTHKFNLKNPLDTNAAFRLLFSGGWTHSNNGILANGTNTFADTFYNPSVNLTSINSNHISIYSRTNSLGGIDMGGGAGAVLVDLELKYSGTSYNWNMASYFAHTNADSTGLYINTRTGANAFKLIKNGSTTLGSSTGAAGTTKPNNTYHIGKRNYDTLWTNREYAFASIGDGLTDTEAVNMYTAVQAFQTTLNRQVGVPIVSDSDAQAFLNAAVIEDITQANAVNTLVTDLKTYGIWSKMKALYPFVGGTAASHKWNLKNPLDTDAAYRLVFNGGWTHSINGAKPNGTNAYADTKLNFNTIMALNDAALSFYSREDIFTAVLMGCGWDSITSMISPNYASGVGEYSTINGGGNGIGVANKSGLFTISRLTSTNVIGYRNGTQYFNRAVTSTLKPNYNVFIGARNYTSATQYSSNQCALSAIHDGLTPTEAANLYTAVQAFQTTLSRQV